MFVRMRVRIFVDSNLYRGRVFELFGVIFWKYVLFYLIDVVTVGKFVFDIVWFVSVRFFF